MAPELNLTYVSLDGLVDVGRFWLLYFLAVFTVYVLVICSNSTIVYIICSNKGLHEPMYVFIAALLVNSVLFSSVIYPKLLLDVLSDRQIISYPACLLQFHVFYSLGGAEFLLLAAMAYDRYVSICRPLQYAAVMRKTTVSVFLLLAWVLPASQVAVPAGLSATKTLCSFSVEAIFCSNKIYKLQCEDSREHLIHDLVILINVALLPLLFILFTYSRILLISYRSSRSVRRKAAQTCLPHLLVLINFSCLCAFEVIMNQVETHLTQTVRLLMALQIVMYHPLFNPIMYGLKMKEISKHLRRLLCPVRSV
ncbi:uncharacterized protein V6R79_007680 [Siganus canaliculatus]